MFNFLQNVLKRQYNCKSYFMLVKMKVYYCMKIGHNSCCMAQFTKGFG